MKSLMHDYIDEFPENIEEALQIVREVKLTPKTIDNVVVCGMGGSSIGGKFIQTFFNNELKVPLVLCQSYDLPAFVTDKSLVVVSSSSGNTEETVSCLEHANVKKANVIAVSSGGKIIEYSQDKGIEFIQLPARKPPRTTLAYSIIALTHIIDELRLVENDLTGKFDSISQFLKENQLEIKNKAKEVSGQLKGTNIVIYSHNKDEALAVRAKQQINENSKQLCWYHVFPEMNHNELVAWAGGNNKFSVVILKSFDWDEQNQKRLEFSKDYIGRKTNKIIELIGQGASRYERLFYLLHLIDWLSLFLAEKNEVDPVEIKVIDSLKSFLEND